MISTMKIFVFLFPFISLSFVECWNCPTHCFCYKRENMMRTDCGGINLFNTFLKFSHETQALDLSRNVISILHGNEFLDANLRQLKHLTLSRNRLHKIDKLSFNGLEDLEYVDLSFNYLEYLAPTTFDSNPNLKVLNVSGNPLKLNRDEAFLSSGPSLQVLSMARCELGFLDVSTFRTLERLRVLNLSDNHIREILPETLEALRDLEHLDISKNDFTCNDKATALLKWLKNRGIRFQLFCQFSQKMLAPVILRTESIAPSKNSRPRIATDDNATQTSPSEARSIAENVSRFFHSIPSLYAALFGTHVGIFIGVLFTYFCMRKSNSPPLRTPSRNLERVGRPERSSRFINNDPDNLTFALIPLSTPPGTPPSPYHSRLTFPSSFSLHNS